MSWFQTDAVLIDEQPRTTVAEGVVLERRSLLRFSAATVAAGLAAACAAPGQRKPAVEAPLEATDGTLDISQFLAEMYPRAKEYVASGGKREESYLMAVGELMARLQAPTPEDTQSAMRSLYKEHGSEERRFEIWVAVFDFEGGKGFSHHDHRDYNGVIQGLEGEARVRNFDVVGDVLVPPKGETFQIRQTRDDLILPGRFSTLGTVRDNVHEVVAGPGGAKLLDVFTYLEKDSRSYSMDVDPTPVDAERGIYEASWA